MKDYLCLSCGEDFNDPLTIGENNSEAVVCPVCKSDNITIQEQFLKRLHKRHGNDGKDFLKLLQSISTMSDPEESGIMHKVRQGAQPIKDLTVEQLDTVTKKQNVVSSFNLITESSQQQYENLNRMYQSRGRHTLDILTDMKYPDRGPGNYGC